MEKVAICISLLLITPLVYRFFYLIFCHVWAYFFPAVRFTFTFTDDDGRQTKKRCKVRNADELLAIIDNADHLKMPTKNNHETNKTIK